MRAVPGKTAKTETRTMYNIAHFRTTQPTSALFVRSFRNPPRLNTHRVCLLLGSIASQQKRTTGNKLARAAGTVLAWGCGTTPQRRPDRRRCSSCSCSRRRSSGSRRASTTSGTTWGGRWLRSSRPMCAHVLGFGWFGCLILHTTPISQMPASPLVGGYFFSS